MRNSYDGAPMHVDPGMYFEPDHPALSHRSNRPVPGSSLIPPNIDDEEMYPGHGPLKQDAKPFQPKTSSFAIAPPAVSDPGTPEWQVLLRHAAIVFAQSFDTSDQQRAVDRFTERGRYLVDQVLNTHRQDPITGPGAINLKEEGERKKPALVQPSNGAKIQGKGQERAIEMIELLDTDDEDENGMVVEEEAGDEAESAMRENCREEQRGFNAL